MRTAFSLHKLRKKIPAVIAGGLLVFLFAGMYLLTLSSTNLKIGNLFFGKISYLYNVNLANFFYINAAYPIIGKEVAFAHYQLSRTYFIRGELQAARNEIKKELEVFPENQRSHYVLGLIYGYLNEEKLAIEAFAKFIEWKPESWAARNDKAWLEFRIGDIDAALTTIQPVAHLTDNAWIQNTYGVLLMNKKKYKEAEQALLYAKAATSNLTEKDWGEVYPGNDPRVYGRGLQSMRESIEKNLELVKEKMSGRL